MIKTHAMIYVFFFTEYLVRSFLTENNTANPFHPDITELETGIPTPVVNTWTEWSSWTDCSKSCGEGRQSRMRECITEGQSVLDCSGPRVQLRSCNEHPCPGMVFCTFLYSTQLY